MESIGPPCETPRTGNQRDLTGLDSASGIRSYSPFPNSHNGKWMATQYARHLARAEEVIRNRHVRTGSCELPLRLQERTGMNGEAESPMCACAA